MIRPLPVLTAVALLLATVYMLWLWSVPDAFLFLCFDDSFYYFEIARNIAAGQGSTFDEIHQTNGYHYLWMALCTAIYALGFDGETAVRVLLSLQLVAYAGAIVLLGLTLQQAVGTWPQASSANGSEPTAAEVGSLRQWFSLGLVAGLGLLLAGPLVAKAFVNGLESGIYLPWYAALLWLAVRCEGDFVTQTTPGQRVMIAALGSLCFLSRSDAGLLLLCLGLSSLPAAWRLGLPGLRRLLELYALPAGVIVSFLAFNQWYFGIPLQVSGELKRTAPDLVRGLIMVVACAVPLLVWLGFRGELREKFGRVHRFLRLTAWFGVFLCLTFAYYFGLQTFPRQWYFGPAIVYGVLLVLIALADLLEGILSESPRPGKAVRTTVVVAVGLMLAALGFQIYQGTSAGLVAMRQANRVAGQWISENLPSDAVLGCWDSGVLAYYTQQRVVNLDGVVNGVAYLRALQRAAQTGEPETAPLLEQAGVSYVVNHVTLTGPDEPNRLELMTRLYFGPTATDGWTLLHEWPFEFAGSTNDESAGQRAMAVRLYRLPR